TRNTRLPGGTFRFPRNSAGQAISGPETHTIWLLADASDTSLSTTMTVRLDPSSANFGDVPAADSLGNVYMAPLMTAAGDAPPVPALVVSPAHPHAGDLVTYTNRSRDASGQPVAAVLDFGDGLGNSKTLGVNASVTHIYTTSGTFG